MPYVSIVKGRVSRRGERTDSLEHKVTVSRHGKKRNYLVFTIGATVLKRLGWLHKDRVDILIDPDDNMVVMRRDAEGLSISVNKSLHGVVRLALDGTTPDRVVVLNHQIVDNELVFDKAWL